MINGKKITAAVLTCSMMLSFAACSKGNPADVADTAEAFAKAVANLDSKKMFKVMEDIDDSKADKITAKLSMSGIEDSGERDLKKTIASTIKYELDEADVEFGKKGDTATSKIEFTMVDYEKVLDDESLTDIDAMKNAIESASKTKTYKVTLELVQDDDEWLVAEDSLKSLDKLYAFLDYEVTIAPKDFSEWIDHTSWFLSDNGKYENTTKIELDIWFTDNPGINVYYVVEKDGTEVYRSDLQSFSTSLYEASYDSSKNAQMSGDYIAEGNYTISVYTEKDVLITSDSTTVSVTSTQTTPSATGTTPSSSTFTVHDSSFVSITEIGWWDYGIDDNGNGKIDEGEGRMVADGVYCIDAPTIAFSIEVPNGTTGPDIYYAYYFVPGENADVSTLDYSKPVDARTISPKYYGQNDQTFYDIDYTPSKMEVGTYVLVIAKDEQSISTPYVTAACVVIPQTKAEFTN